MNTRHRERPSAADAAALVEILRDAVEGGASVGYLRPMDPAHAVAYWEEAFAKLGADRLLLVAREAGEPVGTIQLDRCPRPNGRHRAELMKLLVHRRWRRRGWARALMAAAEDEARAAGVTLLHLDTQTAEPAEALYERLGWCRLGVMPGHALDPDGVPRPTTYLYKPL